MIGSVEEFLRLRASNDSDDFQRIKREEAPPEVWLSLVRDHPDMRFWVAFNRTLPTEVIRLLAEDPDWRVRDKVASRRDTPGDVLERLATDPHDAVLSSVAWNPGTPTGALEILSGHSWDQVRDRAASRLRERRAE